jgi:hypothetical protein
MSTFYTPVTAWAQTQHTFNKQVFANSFKANQLAQLMAFDMITDGTNSKSYFRRAYGEFTNIKYISPGSTILPTADPKIVEIRAFLRNAIEQPSMPSTLREAYTNSPHYMNDPLMGKVMIVQQEMARGAWATAMTGRYIDSCTIASNGSLTAAFVSGTIYPSAYNDNINGNGRLKFDFGTKKAAYSAPGDPEYGPESAALAPGDLITLRSANKDAYITFTVGTLPASDAQAELIFATTNKSPDGLIALMEAGQKSTFGVPTSVTFEHLDALIDKLHGPYRNNRLTALAMDSSQKRALRSLNRMMGGSTLETAAMWELMANVPEELKSLALDKIEMYNGHPLLTVDDLPTQIIGTKATKPIVAVCLDPMVTEGPELDHGGFYGLLRGMPGESVAQAFGFGWRLKYLGEARDKDEVAIRICLDHGWALGSSGAAAMQSGFYNP